MDDSMATSLDDLIKKEGLIRAIDIGISRIRDAILSSTLQNGFEITKQRAILLDAVVRYFYQNTGLSNDNVLLAACASYGREETTPNSDTDLVLVFRRLDKHVNSLWHALQDFYTMHPQIKGNIVIYDLDEALPERDDKHVIQTSLLDLRPIAGNFNLEHNVREQLKAYVNPLEFVLAKSGELKEQQHKFPRKIENLKSFNIKYGIGGLRYFNTAVWLQAIENFESSRYVYSKVPADVMEAVGILLKVRAWLNLRKGPPPGILSNDELSYDDFIEFRKYFGDDSVRVYLSARKVIERYTEMVIGQKTVTIDGGVEYRHSSLRFSRMPNFNENIAFYTLLLNAQKYGLDVSSDEDHNLLARAHDFVQPHPVFLDLFSVRGSLSRTLRYLQSFNVLGKLVPGFSDLEFSLFEPTHRNRGITREGQAIRRIENLETLQNVSGDADEQT
ncbi:hypothetical protein HYW99_00310, partial [Candidatus Woesearchaeota archaeon]|nr:hypothetical protein [Candidatus Woesearchaeota archaeon]